VIVNDAHVRHLPASWGTHPVIGNDAHGQHLPASWGTLYELTKLDKRPGEEGSTSSQWQDVEKFMRKNFSVIEIERSQARHRGSNIQHEMRYKRRLR
jgi:hypothetical protein